MKLKKILALLLSSAMIVTSFAACSSSTTDDSSSTTDDSSSSSSTDDTADTSSVSGSVTVGGSTSVEGVILSSIEIFNETYPDITITYDATGSSTGVKSAASGDYDIGLASRDVKDSEVTEYGVEGTVFAIDGIAVIVNAENTVTDLTVEQIASIADGTITNWSEVGGEDQPITLIGREAGSGTRDGFESIVGIEDCVYEQELTSTGSVIAAVESNIYAIGYASVSAVEGQEGVNALLVNGVEATEANIQDGSYLMQRNFNFVTLSETELSEAAQLFFDFVLSAEATTIITDAGAVPVGDGSSSDEVEVSDLSGSVTVGGSTSVEGVILSSIEIFNETYPDITITYDATGSSTGVKSAASGDYDIGLASRDVKDSEVAEYGVEGTVFAIDGIAVIVNAENTVTDLTVEQIASIADGTITNWSEVGGEDQPITLIGREAGSGTRDGFESIVGVEDCVYEQELTSTGSVIAAVESNIYAIGYASVSAVEGQEGVNALLVNGVEATEANIQDGSYLMQRNFNFVTLSETELSEAAQLFFDFVLSAEATTIITDAGAVPVV
ncbi:MAG: phosphate ABC transporter substrate-binding protein [Clostridia bacterium]